MIIDVFKIKTNEILFQFNNYSFEIVYRKKFLNDMQIIMFLNYQYNFSQIEYQIIEKKTLTIVKCLTKIK